jgi:hypothetical protein
MQALRCAEQFDKLIVPPAEVNLSFSVLPIKNSLFF